MLTKVLLTSAYPISEKNFGPNWLVERSGGLDGFAIVEDPEVADIILFVENHPGYDNYFFCVKSHPYYRRFQDKCVLYHDADRSVTPMRTIAPCLAKSKFDPHTKSSFHFIARLTENECLQHTTDFECERRYLFSFDGSTRTNPIRKRIVALEHPAAHLIDRGQDRAWCMTKEERANYEKDFVDCILASHFVLAPAGVGTSSFRLFEAMQLARPPVIIADEWVPIEGIDWEKCAVVVPERDIEAIPQILEARVDEAAEMGRHARAVWEVYFAPEVSLQRLCERARELVKHPYGVPNYMKDVSQFASPFHFRGLMRFYLKYCILSDVADHLGMIMQVI